MTIRISIIVSISTRNQKIPRVRHRRASLSPGLTSHLGSRFGVKGLRGPQKGGLRGLKGGLRGLRKDRSISIPPGYPYTLSGFILRKLCMGCT